MIFDINIETIKPIKMIILYLRNGKSNENMQVLLIKLMLTFIDSETQVHKTIYFHHLLYILQIGNKYVPRYIYI